MWSWSTKIDSIELSVWIHVVPNLLFEYKLSEIFKARNQVGSSFIENIESYIEGVLKITLIVNNLIMIRIKRCIIAQILGKIDVSVLESCHQLSLAHSVSKSC